MRYSIYCDEASIVQQRYMLIGGLWVPWDAESAVRGSFNAVRNLHQLRSEMKWKKVSRSKLDAYKAYSDVLWTDPNLAFRCIIIDTHILDHKTYNQGDKELGFYKFYHLLVRHNLEPSHLYWLFTDERKTRKPYRLSVLRKTINNWWKQRAHVEPLRNIEPRSSADEDFIQLADVLLGAIAYDWNGYDTSPAKMELARHIAGRMGQPTLRFTTPPRNPKINLWLWQPSASSANKAKPRPGP